MELAHGWIGAPQQTDQARWMPSFQYRQLLSSPLLTQYQRLASQLVSTTRSIMAGVMKKTNASAIQLQRVALVMPDGCLMIFCTWRLPIFGPFLLSSAISVGSDWLAASAAAAFLRPAGSGWGGTSGSMCRYLYQHNHHPGIAHDRVTSMAMVTPSGWIRLRGHIKAHQHPWATGAASADSMSLWSDGSEMWSLSTSVMSESSKSEYSSGCNITLRACAAVYHAGLPLWPSFTANIVRTRCYTS